jgi:hypothetical protein
MAIARAQLVDVSLTRWYHCVTRCVRRAILLAEGDFDRKDWIDHRLQELAEIFAVSVGGFSAMDNITTCMCSYASTRKLLGADLTRTSCAAGAGSFHRGINPASRWLFPARGSRDGWRTPSGLRRRASACSDSVGS